jgi:hypothetical protein
VNHHRILRDESGHTVQSSVSVQDFQDFLDSLTVQTKPAVTKDNAFSLSSLGLEFFLPDLASECAAFPASVDQLASLSELVSQVERHLLILERAAPNWSANWISDRTP